MQIGDLGGLCLAKPHILPFRLQIVVLGSIGRRFLRAIGAVSRHIGVCRISFSMLSGNAPRVICLTTSHGHVSRSCLFAMPRHLRSALECLTHMPLDHASPSSPSFVMPHNLSKYRWERRVLWKGRSIAITAHSIQTRLKGIQSPHTDHLFALDADLTARADKKPATPSNMDAQRQTLKTSSSKQVSKTSAPRSVSRSPSMQVEDGREVSTTEISSKSQGKETYDSSYSMDRWLSQKPSEEPYHGSGR
jgi:hypothetical protein